MAYQATTAAGTGDVLDKIRLFAIAQGWTENRWRDSTETHLGKELCISHADAGYFNLMHNKSLYALSQPNSDNDIVLNASSGFDATKKTYEQADKSADSVCALYDYDDANTRNVYLFGNTQYIYVAQELATNFYTHLCFGKIDKAWSYTGGQFVSATWWNFQHGRRRTRTIADRDTISIFSPGFTSKGRLTYPIYSTSLRCDFADSIGANWHNSDKSKKPGRTRSH